MTNNNIIIYKGKILFPSSFEKERQSGNNFDKLEASTTSPKTILVYYLINLVDYNNRSSTMIVVVPMGRLCSSLT